MAAFPDIELPEIVFPDIGLLPSQITPGGFTRTYDGQLLFAASTSKAYILRQFITLQIPKWDDCTPSDLGNYQIQAIAVSPFLSKTAIPGYILAYNSSTDKSAVWFSPDIYRGRWSVQWAKGADASGFYNIIRATNVDGGILAYSPGAQTGSITNIDLTATNGGFVTTDPLIPTAVSDYPATWAAGVGWKSFPNPNFTSSPPNYDPVMGVVKHLGASTYVRSVEITYHCDAVNGGGGTRSMSVGHSSTTDASIGLNAGAGTFTTILTVNANVEWIYIELDNGTDGAPPNYLTYITIDTRNPSGSAKVAYSSDNGATWNSPQTLSLTPVVVGGFDVQRAGANQFGAANGAIYRATSLGGAFSSYYSITGGRDATCIIVPYFNWAGTKQTDAANPDILVGLNGADGSGRSLLWIEGGGTIHDLTPVAGSSFDNPNSITCRYASEIALFCKVSGATTKLYKTTNANSGASWTLVKSLLSPQWIRCRRNDDRPVPKGQLFLADNDMWYTSQFASNGVFERYTPTPIVTADPIY